MQRNGTEPIVTHLLWLSDHDEMSKSDIPVAAVIRPCLTSVANAAKFTSRAQTRYICLNNHACAARFDRENFIIVPQVRRFGYRFHADGKRFDRVTDSEAWLCGSGYALQQLTWDREAYIMATNYTARSFLQGSVLEHLKAKNVQ